MIDYDYLVMLAKASIEHGFEHDAALFLNPRHQPAALLKESCVFVTLRARGITWCIGNTKPAPLFHSVMLQAFNSAFYDNRVQPLNRNLANEATLEISHLYGEPESSRVIQPAHAGSFVAKDDTIQLQFEGYMATMLASEQPRFPTIDAMIVATRKKANIPEYVNWNHIAISRIKTIKTPIRNYIDIPCLNIA